MRILYFSRSYTAHDYRFLSALGDSCHETYFIYLEDDPVVQETRTLPPAVKPLDWANKSRPQSLLEDPTRAIEEFAAILDAIRPDLVHAGPIPTCGYIAAMAKAHPLMLMSWGSDLLVDADRNHSLHDRTCFALNHSEMLVADCNEVADKAQKLTGYAADRIVQFPWGVDLDVFRPGSEDAGLRRLFGEDSFVLLSTRGWEKSYGILHLLGGFLEAHKVDPRLRLFLLGGGSLRPEIETFVKENGLADAVRMPGQIPAWKLPEYFRAADLYVSCAFSDGSSISLLEAMASGLPVIATDRASNREWIEEGAGGLLVQFGNSAAVRDAILRISSMSKEQREDWGDWNLAIARERADWKKNFQKLLAGYERIRAITGAENESP
jgi:glycosyltransferase involved in cell wall biosynthesis